VSLLYLITMFGLPQIIGILKIKRFKHHTSH